MKTRIQLFRQISLQNVIRVDYHVARYDPVISMQFQTDVDT